MRIPLLLAAALLVLGAPFLASAQQPGGRPPAVGVAIVAKQPVRPSLELVGRVQATDRVNVVARVTAYIDQRLFDEGAEVKKGDLLYRLEQGPFQADVAAKQAAIDQFDAQLQNATLTFNRQKALISTPAGQQSNVDAALSAQLALKAQREAAEAQLRMSQINLAYTEIRAPIDGKIGRSALTVGNVVSPGSGVLVSIVSQDPIYIVFPISVRALIDMRERLAERGGIAATLIKIRLPNGEMYGQTGKLDFVDNSVNATTDTIILRGIMPNPLLSANGPPTRTLVDNELVTVTLEEAQPIEALTVPRAGVLSDQQGNYVFVVGDGNVAQQRRVTLDQGSSSPTRAAIAQGLTQGETVIVEGVQRVRPGQPVAPAPASQAADTVPAAGGSSAPPRP